jgi:adenylate cyclase class 2
MATEVEAKARAPPGVEKKLTKLGAAFTGEETQKDEYYNHPTHDFTKTDEALRIRSVFGKLTLTYKGPKKPGKTKTRTEVEAPASNETKKILKKLGFSRSLVISKKRRLYTLENLLVCVDDVRGLGRYVEVESKNPQDEPKILALMRKIGVKPRECTTKTYAQLLEETKSLKQSKPNK